MSEVEVTQVDQEEYPEMHRVLELALEAGRILLRNGAEIFRVEETIEHICKRFGVEAVDSFVLSNGIFLTAYSKGIRSEKHTSELQSHVRISYAVFCLKKKTMASGISS